MQTRPQELPGLGWACTDCTAASATAALPTTRPHSQPSHHTKGVRQSGTSSTVSLSSSDDYRPHMNWGDVSSWAALVVAIAAAIVSFRALKHSKDSAAEAKRSADAAERSAAADEAVLAEARREAEERRVAEAEASRPRPELRVETAASTPEMGVRGNSRRYILRNAGTGPAENVTAVHAREAGRFRNMPSGVTLRPGEGHEFRILRLAGQAPPSTIHISWDGQDDAVALPLPQ